MAMQLSRQPVHRSKYFVVTYDVILPVVVMLLIVTGVIVTLKSSVFRIEKIKCTVDYQECPVGNVMAELEKYLGRNLVTLQTQELHDRLTMGDFTIREATVKKQLPDTLVIDMQSVYPVVAIRVVGSENEWIVFDSRYRAVGKRNQDPNVPTVLVPQAPTVHVGGRIDDEQLVKALDYSREITMELNSVKTLSLTGETLTLSLEGNRQALLSTTKDVQEQIRILQAILASTTISSSVRSIDVRFSKPVIR